MGLVKNNNKNTHVIPRGADIKPKNEFSINDLEEKETVEKTHKFEYVPGVTSIKVDTKIRDMVNTCLLYTSPSPRDMRRSRMPSSA